MPCITPGIFGPLRLPWDAQADRFALTQYYNGKTITEISSQLILQGYKASKTDVSTNLNRLGVALANWEASNFRLWDGQADTVVYVGHYAGKTVAQILDQLTIIGYHATRVGVAVSLSRQGVHNVRWGEPEVPCLRTWDACADVFALAAHNAGQTALQIAALLRTYGYSASATEAVESLHRQGVWNAPGPWFRKLKSGGNFQNGLHIRSDK